MPRRVKIPDTAMVLAAGRGKRMRNLTDRLPKPLVTVAGKPLIDHVLDRLVEAGVTRAVVNLNYLGERIAGHLAGRDDIAIEFSRESEALETGGGIKQALPMLGEVFFAVNADVFWLDSKDRALERLAATFAVDGADALLLMQPTSRAIGYEGAGDFLLDPMGQARRRGEREIAPYVFAGVEIVHRRLFDDAPAGAFSINRLWDGAIEHGRLGGLVHDGEWYHIGTPEGLAMAEAGLKTRSVDR